MAFQILRLAGRCANGAERDCGVKYHMVPAVTVRASDGTELYARRTRGADAQALPIVCCNGIGTPRLLLASGLFLAAFSLWEMTQFNIDVGVWDIVRTGIVQGAGLGLIFVPLSAITFSTLPADLRTEAAGLFSLMRNIGSSVGISIVTALLTRGTQINHAQLAEHVTPYMDALQAPGYPAMWSLNTTGGLAALNQELTRQAQMVAYLDDFQLLMWVTLAALPLILLLRKNQRPVPKEALDAAVE